MAKTKKRFIALGILISAGLVLSALIYDGIIWFVYPEYMGYEVRGIDVARYQGDIDWQKIYNQNIVFAFIKATEGSSYTDPELESNISGARENEIYTGAYHFFSSESQGKTQAENFINAVSAYPLDLPPVLDFEIPKTVKDKTAVISQAKVFLQELEAHYGVTPIIYTTYESYNAFLTEGFSDYPLWFRDLLKEPDILGGGDWLFWQYCNRGRLKGIDEKQRYVDLNVFNGSKEEFVSLYGEIN